MILRMSAVWSEIYRQAGQLRCALAVIDALSKNDARWIEMGLFEHKKHGSACASVNKDTRNNTSASKFHWLPRNLCFAARSKQLLLR